MTFSIVRDVPTRVLVMVLWIWPGRTKFKFSSKWQTSPCGQNDDREQWNGSACLHLGLSVELSAGSVYALKQIIISEYCPNA
jgi:hypothetical protein